MASSSDNIRNMMAKAKQAEATRKRMAGLFGKAYDEMPWYDKAALYTSLVPVLGDIVGLGAVDLSTPVPKGVTREQLSRIQAVANTPFKKDYSRVAVEAGMFGPGRASKPVGRTDTDPDKMIEYENLVNQLDLSRGGFGVR